MGCDIHLSVETKDRYNAFSTLIRDFDLDRNYAMFAAMANVRNYDSSDFVSEPRGLPEDMRIFDRERFLQVAEYSFSYLSADEYKRALSIAKSNTESIQEIGIRYKALECLLDFITSNGIEARIIFGFD